MKNRSIVISFLAALIFAACTSTPKSYIVEGVVSNSYNNQMVYMSDYETNENTDSALVVNGKFIFTGSVDTAVIQRLDLADLYANLILENGKIYVDMVESTNAKGTPLNDKLSEYLSILTNCWNEYYKRDNEISQIQDIDEETRTIHLEYFNQCKQKTDSLSSKVFNENKNNALGSFVLWTWASLLKPDQFESVYTQAGDIVRQFKVLKNIFDANAKKKQTAAGMPFVDFTIENGNRDGSKVSLSDYVGKGKYVLVDFWASWCGPCIAEIPVLVEVYHKYKGDKFELLGVAVWDQREETLKSIERHNTPWPQIIDASDIPTNLYGIQGIPHIILFGPDGKIIARDLRGDQLKAKVAEVMK